MKNITFESPIVGLSGAVWLGSIVHYNIATPNVSVMLVGAFAAVICASASINNMR